MSNQDENLSFLEIKLAERQKELNCLYEVEELLSNQNNTLESIIVKLLKIMPKGMRFPEHSYSRAKIYDLEFASENYRENNWHIQSEVYVQDTLIGRLMVGYVNQMPEVEGSAFLSDEQRLLNSIATRLSHFILYKNLRNMYDTTETKRKKVRKTGKPEWKVVADLLKKTDQHLFSIISRKMLNFLFTKGVTEAKDLFVKLGTLGVDEATRTEVNRPSKKQVLVKSFILGEEIFKVASLNLSSDEILALIMKWMNEEKSHFLVKVLSNQNTPLSEVSDAIRKYYNVNPIQIERSSAISKGIIVSLIRRILTDQLEYINISKEFFEVSDFFDLLQKMIFPIESHGKIGGKGAGIFLARKIIETQCQKEEIFKNIKTPKTWYITSDGIINFIYYNNFEDVIEHKYKNIEEIRKEYHHIIQAFKNSQFSFEITNGLSRCLDDFGDNPIIVRSSSLLEDRLGSAFAGKYKSLFLANQGTKQERLDALMDAIAEVYASTIGPDPIGYRIERGLLDFNEEMGIMIQEVVGTKVGKYFFPAFAGVAFSNNEFRWSPRIKREDGLIRMVAGLGTRAVDRISNDFPILITPGQPNLRVNLSFDEIINYSPKFIDVINLETNTFESLQIEQVLKDIGNSFPMLNEIFSIIDDDQIKKPVGIGIDTSQHSIVATFDNLISNTPFVKQLGAILKLLKEKMSIPVDIEFASNGKDLYILQCRPQSSAFDSVKVEIPNDIPNEKLLFSTDKHISNGRISDINYIVYVDPLQYAMHNNYEDLKEIARVVGKLNKLLPKKGFILLGPGRWGSRGDIRLGVSVTYSDICNTALLIEIAKKKGNYVPELSFGTHFFQDLVEAGIKYLPIYPDENGTIFNEAFLQNSDNILTRFLPEYEYLTSTVRVINVSEVTGTGFLQVLMNADEERAIAFFADANSGIIGKSASQVKGVSLAQDPSEWRLLQTELIVKHLDMQKFGIKGLYLFGTVNSNSATYDSDIDLLIVYDGNEAQKSCAQSWFDAWNVALIEVYFKLTGYRVEKMLDSRFISIEELKESEYYSMLARAKSAESTALKIREELQF